MPTATITWTPPADTDLAGYEVHRALGGAALTLLATIGKVTTYVDSTVPAVSQNVSYGMKSIDLSGNKSVAMSNVIVRTVDVTPPQAPVILDVVLS